MYLELSWIGSNSNLREAKIVPGNSMIFLRFISLVHVICVPSLRVCLNAHPLLSSPLNNHMRVELILTSIAALGLPIIVSTVLTMSDAVRPASASCSAGLACSTWLPVEPCVFDVEGCCACGAAPEREPAPRRGKN